MPLTPCQTAPCLAAWVDCCPCPCCRGVLLGLTCLPCLPIACLAAPSSTPCCLPIPRCALLLPVVLIRCYVGGVVLRWEPLPALPPDTFPYLPYLLPCPALPCCLPAASIACAGPGCGMRLPSQRCYFIAVVVVDAALLPPCYCPNALPARLPLWCCVGVVWC